MFYVGLDLGQRQDFSALAVVERRERVAIQRNYVDWRESRTPEHDGLVVRYVKRMKQGTPYAEVVRRVVELLHKPALAGKKRLAVDATGVGMPVVEMLVAARPGCEVMPVMMTGGVAEHTDGRVWHVPKLDLMAGLQGLLERGELGIVRQMDEVDTLVKELMSVQANVRTSGRLRVGADACGEHDDLVIAVALACWSAKKATIGLKGPRLFW